MVNLVIPELLVVCLAQPGSSLGELGLTVNAVGKWKAGDRYPANAKATLVMLDQLSRRKRIPKKRRYGKESGS